MRDYFLFVDTETSGLPKNWELPYSNNTNWPYILQIAWIIYKADGTEIKRENHYLKGTGFRIKPSAIKIHHITTEYLHKNGEDKKEVMMKLSQDLERYQPMLVAHFIELDYHMLNVEFHRTGIKSAIAELPRFCTMKASVPYVINPNFKYLKLNRFYKTLFNKKPEVLHNALSDATLMSEIFFHLYHKGEVTDEIIQAQAKDAQNKRTAGKNIEVWMVPVLLIIAALLLILLYDEY